jgi:outer membrane protein W
MINRDFTYAALALTLVLSFKGSPAIAHEKEDFILRGGIINVAPQETNHPSILQV